MAFDLFKHKAQQQQQNNEVRSIHQHLDYKYLMSACSSMDTSLEWRIRKIHLTQTTLPPTWIIVQVCHRNTRFILKQLRGGFRVQLSRDSLAQLNWKHHNDCMANGATPSVQQVVQQSREEAQLWCGIGATRLSQHGLFWSFQSCL